MPKGSSGIKRGAPSSGMIRGVPVSEIERRKGTRDHQGDYSMRQGEVREDYGQVGIELNDYEAQEIHIALARFTFMGDTDMRQAASKFHGGERLTKDEQRDLERIRMCEEYCQIAPSLPVGKYKTIYRGVKLSETTPEYAEALMSKKIGEAWDIDRMPTSFSTSLSVAEKFAQTPSGKGIIVHMPTRHLKNAPSIRGISQCPKEDEVLVADYNWRVSRISDKRTSGDGYYHIYLRHSR